MPTIEQPIINKIKIIRKKGLSSTAIVLSLFIKVYVVGQATNYGGGFG